MTLIHATCVAIGGTGILIRGKSGAGKSDLALRLIDDGATLVSDDYCHVIEQDGFLIAKTPDSIAGKIEVRGFGIVELPHKNVARINLVVDLVRKEDIPRLPETQTCTIEGIMISHLTVDPETPSAAARVRLIAGQVSV